MVAVCLETNSMLMLMQVPSYVRSRTFGKKWAGCEKFGNEIENCIVLSVYFILITNHNQKLNFHLILHKILHSQCSTFLHLELIPCFDWQPFTTFEHLNSSLGKWAVTGYSSWPRFRNPATFSFHGVLVCDNFGRNLPAFLAIWQKVG